MNQAKFESVMQGQSGVAKKIYECVPVREPWSVAQIMDEIARTTRSQADKRIVEGCLYSLRSSGLVVERPAGHFSRVQVTPRKEKVSKAAEKKEVGPMDALADLAGSVRALADLVQGQLCAIADKIDDVALSVEQSRTEDAQSAKKLRQLQELLKEVTA